jgi:protoporphyrinogen oxidase
VGSPSHTIVLGGGISGLGVAWRLCEGGTRVTVLESEGDVGGLAGTRSFGEYRLDVGPHSFFSDDHEILKTVLGLFDPPLEPRRRDVKFYYRGKYLDYPLTAAGALLQMGLGQGLRAAWSFLVRPRRVGSSPPAGTLADRTVEQWAIESFGEHLYESFFKPYTEQFWKLPCRELSARSIPSHTRTSFTNTLKVMLGRRATRRGDSLVEREQLPTYYPATGFGEIAGRIADRVRAGGGTILTGARAREVETSGGRGVRVAYDCGEVTATLEGDRVVSTIPLPLLVEMLRPRAPAEVRASAARLEFRGLLALGMVTERTDDLGASYVYVLDRPYNRVSSMNRFSPETSPPGENVIVVEMPCLVGTPIWDASPEEVFRMCADSLARDGILLPGDVKKLLMVKAPYAYPVYRKDYALHLQRALAHVRSHPRLETLGRSGEFMYGDSDVCLRRAFDLATRLLRSS